MNITIKEIKAKYGGLVPAEGDWSAGVDANFCVGGACIRHCAEHALKVKASDITKVKQADYFWPLKERLASFMSQ